VHCAAGISRSSSVVCAFLMATESLTFEQALEEVKKARPFVSPNMGFRRQLRLWQEMGCTIEGTTKAHAMYKMERAASQFSKKKSVDPDGISYGTKTKDSHFKCAKCQGDVFSDEHLIEHEKGISRWGWRLNDSVDRSCNIHSIQIMDWMRGHVESVGSGDLKCPTPDCGAILGSWDWSDRECSCQTNIRPAFVILKSKVTRANY